MQKVFNCFIDPTNRSPHLFSHFLEKNKSIFSPLVTLGLFTFSIRFDLLHHKILVTKTLSLHCMKEEDP
jgi:hypothetical protein